ncbi:hypothetical protein [Eikenella sp. NML03-A-027]|uniref:hypothetical protein n=1 Tax=Eikenella sp. NML03-A-027 TaxID=1795828 RepID=UPI000ADCE6F0|nr:hypothetical protein [Eikenella sp. NML03-A-027]
MRLPADWQGFNAATCELVDEGIVRAQDSQGHDVFADWQEYSRYAALCSGLARMGVG